MEKNPNEIPMFARFVERGLALPASDFFKGLLNYYGIEYLNLNPNGIFHVSVFVHFCEVFLGIKPHYLGGYQDRLFGGPLGLPGVCHTAPDDVRRKDYGGEVLG
jgi:hypothetical protein